MKPEVCAHCGKLRGHHKAKTFLCPRGPKTRAGYLDFGPDTFELKVTKPRKPAKKKKTKPAEPAIKKIVKLNCCGCPFITSYGCLNKCGLKGDELAGDGFSMWPVNDDWRGDLPDWCPLLTTPVLITAEKLKVKG